MILVDTSVWIDHFRRTNGHLADLLNQGDVVVHPFIIGELACGHIMRRNETIALLQYLPSSELATHGEVLHYIEMRRLFGTGLGYVDVHLLAAAEISGYRLWSVDKPLRAQAHRLQLVFEPSM